MAGDWIKMRVGLTYDLKVMQIGRHLNGNPLFLETLAPGCRLDEGHCNAIVLHTYAIGALHRFWCATQEATRDGNLGSLGCDDIDCLVECPGFSDALIAVGWLEKNADGSLQVHNWQAHNGDSAKKRAEATGRVQKHREVKRKNVTPVKRKSVTREEKRREEKSIKKSKPKENRFKPPTLAEVTDYCRERSNAVDPQRFIDFYESKGWVVGKSSMKSWKACVRTWEKHSQSTQADPRGTFAAAAEYLADG